MRLLLLCFALFSSSLSGDEFKSLKGQSHQAFWKFFSGEKKIEDTLFHSMGDPLDDRLPEGFWEMGDPRTAALALIEANRSERHQKYYEIGFREEEGLPASGWLHFHFNSSSCYAYSSRDVLMGFGEAGPSMFVVESDSPGVVWHNPWADLSGYQVFEVPVTTGELTFASQVLLWLGHLKTEEITDPPNQGIQSSTADGFVTLDVHEYGKSPSRAVAATAWVSGSIRGRWEGDFFENEEAIASLMELFVEKGIRDRWERPEPIFAPGLMGETEGWGESRVSAEAIEMTTRVLKRIYRMDRKGRLPAGFLRSCLEATGSLGLGEFQEDLRKMELTISENPGRDEKELERLREQGLRNQDPFASGVENGAMQAKLWDKLQFHRGYVLREVLQRSLRKLELSGNENALVDEVQNQGELLHWALGTLARNHRDAWIAEMFQQFRETPNPESRRMIFETLGAVDREAGKLLISTLNAKFHQELFLEIAEFWKGNEPARLMEMYPGLVKLLDDGKLKDDQKEQVYVMLAGLPVDVEKAEERRELILKLFKNPPAWLSAGVRFQGFLELAPKAGDLDLLWSEKLFLEQDAELGIRLICSRSSDPEQKRDHLERFMEHQIAGKTTRMDTLAKICLAFDLRKFAPEMKMLATRGPDEVEGKRFHSARFLTALWAEEDSGTLGRMWIDWMSTQAWYFGGDQFPMAELKKRCREKVAKLPPQVRAQWIEEAMNHQSFFNGDPGSVEWLRSLKY